MRINSALKLKQAAWASGVLVVLILLIVGTHSEAKPSAQERPVPVVEVPAAEQRDIFVYGEWIGTLTRQVNAAMKAQVTGYLLTRNHREGSLVRTGHVLFQMDARPFQAALAQAKYQLAQAQAQFIQDQARLATTEASQLDVEKYAPLAKVDEVSKQDFDDATQTNLANKAQVKGAAGAIAAAKVQIEASEAAVETATINLGFTRLIYPSDGISGIAQAQVGALRSTSSAPLTTVSTLDRIRDYFTLSEQQYLASQRRLSGSEKDHRKLQLILADGTTYPPEDQVLFRRSRGEA